jgi:membrane-associated phospholipid phosphatase
LTLAWAAQPLAVRLLGLLWPVLMLTTVIVTGNHYISDGLGALAVLILSFLPALFIERWRGNDPTCIRTLARLQRLRHHRG